MTRKLNALYRPPHAVAYTANGHTFWMIPIPKGGFWMGEGEATAKDADEKPRHWVELSQSYELGQFPVTQALWEAVMGENPSKFKGDARPVERISWENTQAFIARLNELPEIATINAAEGYRFQLPTEAQWEYAARGGRYVAAFDYRYAGSSHAPEVAWYDENSQEETQPVGRKRPNALGLYDMSGDVHEWCEDYYDGMYYTYSPKIDPRGPDTGSYRLLRGGSWRRYPGGVRAANRSVTDLADTDGRLGFRLARAAHGF